MRTLHVGIANYEQMKARTLAIARGEYKPAAGEPKVWFTSPESFARVLSDKNRALLAIIAESAPESLARLNEAAGAADASRGASPQRCSLNRECTRMHANHSSYTTRFHSTRGRRKLMSNARCNPDAFR